MKRIIKIIFLAICIGTIAPSYSQTGIITHFAGTADSVGFGGDGGQATSAILGTGHKSIACDGAGNVYISDYGRIRKVDATGIITTIAGTGIPGRVGDGGPASAAQVFGGLGGIAVDRFGNIYFCDSARVRKINTSGIVTTIAGNGALYYNGDGIPATSAAMDAAGVAIDYSGNIIVCDAINNRVRKMNSSGIIATIATANSPQDPVIDRIGNIYFGDYTWTISKLDTSGVTTNYAGTVMAQGFSGDGGPATAAEIYQAYGLSIDAVGNIYFTDEEANRVRMVSTSGIINTIAGSGPVGLIAFSGDGGPATAAHLYAPASTAVDPSGNIFVYDDGSNTVRKITNPSLNVSNAVNHNDLRVYPNPAKDFIKVSGIMENTNYRLVSVTGSFVQAGTLEHGNNAISLLNNPPGIYILELTSLYGERKNIKVLKE